jgi:hypothetical protein
METRSIEELNVDVESRCEADAKNVGRVSRALRWMSAFISVLVVLICVSEVVSVGALALLFEGSRPEETHLQHSYYLKQPWSAEYWREFVNSWKTEYRPYLVWRRAAFSGKYVNVDAEGLRRTVNPNCVPGATRIWMFGSSPMWGTGAKDDQTIPSLLSAEYARAVGPVCVTNYGESAWVNMQEVIQLELALKRAVQPPDLVIFYDGFSDVFMQYQSGEQDAHQNVDQLRKLIDASHQRISSFKYLAETNTYRLIEAATDRVSELNTSFGPAAKPAQELDRMAGTAVTGYRQNMKLVHALSSEYGFRYLSIWAPMISLGEKPLSPHEQQVLLSMQKQTPGLPELCKKSYALVFSVPDPHYIDFANVFDRAQEDIYLDKAHTTPVGNQLVSERMVEEIRRSGIEPGSRRGQP